MNFTYRELPNDYLIETTGVISTELRGYKAEIQNLLELLPDGTLIVHPGFAWDGASGPAVDTESIMLGALVHDAFYTLIQFGALHRDARKAADQELRRYMLEFALDKYHEERSGVKRTLLLWVRRARIGYVYLAVRLFGGVALRKGKRTMLKKLAASLLITISLSGCASFWTAARTADDIAREACALHFAERQGISLKEAAAAFCTARSVIDVFSAAQDQAGDDVASTMGLPPR